MNIYHKIKLTTIIAITSLFCVSCDLTLLPESSISPENYFKSASDLQLWSNNFYSMLLKADEMTSKNADDVLCRNYPDYMMGTRSAATENGWNWTQLRNINLLLQYSENCSDNSARIQYEGVAYFFRAYFYFEKVKRYGDVPWYDEVIESDDNEALKKPRDDRGFVVDRVLEDLDKAIAMLPKTKDFSRVTKWSALALKSRVALFEGTFRKYHNLGDYEKYLTEAYMAGEELMISSGYSITNSGTEPYRELFCNDKSNGAEVILARIYNFPALNISNSIQQNYLNLRTGFTRRFMNHYLMADGTRFTAQSGYATKTYLEETQNRDPRMSQTVLCSGYKQKGESAVISNTLLSETGYQPIKFVGTKALDGSSKSNIDAPIFRIAEVLLNVAEAKAELDIINQTDINNTINKIRGRVNMPGLVLVNANSTPDLLLKSYYPNVANDQNLGIILEVRRERTIELVLEGNRYWDMFRWKEGAQIVNETNQFIGCYFAGVGKYDMDGDGKFDIEIYTDNASGSVARTFKLDSDIVLSNGTSGYVIPFPTVNCTWDEERDYLWPIPVAQRVLTDGVLTQNKGWEDGVNF